MFLTKYLKQKETIKTRPKYATSLDLPTLNFLIPLKTIIPYETDFFLTKSHQKFYLG